MQPQLDQLRLGARLPRAAAQRHADRLTQRLREAHRSS